MISKKIKITALWVLVFLTIVNLAILITVIFYLISSNNSKQIKENFYNNHHFTECPADCDSITLKKYSKFKTHYRKRTSPLVDSLRELRFAMMDELKKNNPDTAKLNKLADKSGVVYSLLRKKTVNQLMLMKDSFPPEFRRNFIHKCGRNDYEEHKFRKNKFHKRADNNKIKHHRIGNCRRD